MKTVIFTLLALFFSTALISQSLENGLVAKYTFDKSDYQNETFLDVSGDNNFITCFETSFFDNDITGNNDAAIATAYPEPTTYMQLNGNNDKVAINELSSFTISFWTIQGSFSNVYSGFSPILNVEDENGNAYNLELNKETKEIYLRNMVYANAGASIHNSGSDTYINGWYHVAMIIDKDENQMTLYLDSEEIGSINLTSLPAPNNPVITFGKYRNGDHAVKTTCFDEMYIHNRVLTKEEIELARGNVFTTSENNILPAEELNIYPNPAKDVSTINIEFPDATSKTLIDIIDVQGRVVRTEKLNNQQINIAQLAKGIYLFKIKTTEGIYIKKVVIE